MSNLHRNLFGGVIAAIYLGTSVVTHMDSLHTDITAQPSLTALVIYSLAPLCSAIGIFFLYQFSLSRRDSLTGLFNPSSLRAIGRAGLAFTIVAAMTTIERALTLKLTGLTDLPPFDPSVMLLFIVIAGAFTAISRTGGHVLRNATQMRDDLNEIV